MKPNKRLVPKQALSTQASLAQQPAARSYWFWGPTLGAALVGCGAGEPWHEPSSEEAASSSLSESVVEHERSSSMEAESDADSATGEPQASQNLEHRPSIKSVDSGVIETKVLSNMTFDEAVDVCLAFADEFVALESSPRVREAGCAINSYNASVAAQEPFDPIVCESDGLRCDSQLPPQIVAAMFSKVPPCETNDAIANAILDCQASVAEIELCLGSMIGVFEAVFTGLDCQGFAAPDFDGEAVIVNLRDTDPFRDPPTECDAVLGQCPYVFGGSPD